MAVSSAGSHVPSGVSGSLTSRLRHFSEAKIATRTKARTMRRSFFTSWTIVVHDVGPALDLAEGTVGRYRSLSAPGDSPDIMA